MTTEANRRHEPRDWRPFWRWTAVLLLPLGPLLIVVGRGLLPYWTNDAPEEIVASVIAAPGVMDAIGWLGLIGQPAMLIGVLAIGYVARKGAPLLATLGAGFTFVAFANWTAAGNPDMLALVMDSAGFTAAEITDVGAQLSSTPIASVVGGFWIVGHILGMILLGLAVGRARIVPWWVAIALIVSQPVHVVAAVVLPSPLLDMTLGWGLTTLAFAAVAVAIARMSDDEWDARTRSVTSARSAVGAEA